MQVNSSLTHLESLPLTTELTPDDAETDKEPVEIPLGKQSIAVFTQEAGSYLGQRGNSIANHKSEELRQTLVSHRHERQLVILQDFPDPDALSSAWAYQLIAQQYDIKCEIIYAGTLSHQENIALVKLTGLPAHRWSMPTLRSKDLSSYQGFVLIDNQGTTSGLLAMVLSSGIPLVAVIGPSQLSRRIEIRVR